MKTMRTRQPRFKMSTSSTQTLNRCPQCLLLCRSFTRLPRDGSSESTLTPPPGRSRRCAVTWTYITIKLSAVSCELVSPRSSYHQVQLLLGSVIADSSRVGGRGRGGTYSAIGRSCLPRASRSHKANVL